MSYTKHNFATGGTIQAAPFNEMEDQIAANETAIAGKQAALTFDDAPTQNSDNPVKSGGVYEALAGKASSSAISGLASSLSEVSRRVDRKLGKPSTDGTSGQLLRTNGDGTTAWISLATDDTLTVQGQAADAKAAGDALALKAASSDLTALGTRVTALENLSLGVTSGIKEALLQIARKAAYIDGGGQTYYQALYSALYADRVLSSITAVLTLGNHTVHEDDTLDSLRPYLTVTAHYSDSSTATVSGYTLGGTLAAGVNTVTVSYEGKTTSFTVTAASLLPTGYTRLTYVSATGEQYVDTGLTSTQPDRAEYEIMYTAMPSTKGGHIVSNTCTYFPFFKGSVSDASTKVVQAIYWLNEEFIGSNSYEWALNTRYKIEGFPDAHIKVNDVTVCSLSKGSTAGSSNFFLFTYGGSVTSTQYRFYGRLYYAKVWDSSGVLLRSFVPCKNGSDVAGLYDTVTDTFYTSDSGTDLVAGEVA